MNKQISPIVSEAIRDNPSAVYTARKIPEHCNDCDCTGCTPVLTEKIWFGEETVIPTDPVPQNDSCSCGKPLKLAARGLLEVLGEYTLVNKWYYRCDCGGS